MCEHQLMLENSWLSGPRIVCRACGKRWDVRGRMLADACCWGVDLIATGVLAPAFFGRAAEAFLSLGQWTGLIGGLLILGMISPFVIAAHFGVFALGHGVHAWCIRRSGDLRRRIPDDPYHQEFP